MLKQVLHLAQPVRRMFGGASALRSLAEGRSPLARLGASTSPGPQLTQISVGVRNPWDGFPSVFSGFWVWWVFCSETRLFLGLGGLSFDFWVFGWAAVIMSGGSFS